MKSTVLAVVPFFLGIVNAYSGDMTYYETGKPPSTYPRLVLNMLTHTTQASAPAAKHPKTPTPSSPSRSR